MGRRASVYSTEEAKRRIVDALRRGLTVKDACQEADRSVTSYNQYRSRDSSFKEQCDLARSGRGAESDEEIRQKRAGAFEDFRAKYLGMETFTHQLQWIDLIEGREPRDLHPAIKYEPGSRQHILINCPPEHSKTMTLSVDYVTYRICKDPNVRILLVSKTQEMSKQFVYAVKQRLTHPRYSRLQADFAPVDGFKGPGTVWQSTQVYLGSESRDSSEKDPTLACLGIGGQIYGARADLILLDDCIVLSNANQFESQIRWVQQEVLTRLGPAGRLIVAGTRVDSVDFYRELRNPDRYPDGKSPWTYLAQPAVLQYADDPADWVTLWPRSNVPWIGAEDAPDAAGLYPRWDGKRLYARRGILDPRTWSMVYQQQDVSEASIFTATAIRACVNGNRTVGLLKKENKYHRDQGMDGLYVIASMDPAMAGETATVIYGVDVKTQMRYVLDAHRMPNPSPQQIKDLIRGWTEKYSPNTWVIEKNAFQLYLTRDEEIRSYLANRGVTMQEHYTGSNKLDPDFGVASIAPLFSTQMIELPSSHNSEGIKALIEQLITWQPGIKGKDLKMDLPMALWFAELKARNLVEQHTMKSNTHHRSRYTPRYRLRRQATLYLDDLMEDQWG
ncbi:hypothetical protein AB0C33_01935 [Nonomuraea sp. NPDC048881]|uniref:hypothetical protein n=1 Tax=Nonomuraea sp. NPDC048881 TaxID=3155030 RepID=UPI0034071817